MQLLKTLALLYFILLSTWGFAQNTHYYVLFSARFPTMRPFSISGHAFITWRSEDTLAQKFEQYSYGFFPKKGVGLFNSTEGVLVEGYAKNSNRERLVRRFIIEIDSAQFAESLKEVALWQKESYQLLNNNCVHFMNQIATKLNLKTVSTNTCLFPIRPFRYIKHLKKTNKTRIVKNSVLERVRLRMLRVAEIEEEMDDEEE
jgi:hypothetical protein